MQTSFKFIVGTQGATQNLKKVSVLIVSQYLTHYSMSVPTERLFSKAGELVSAKRSNEISKLFCSITKDSDF